MVNGYQREYFFAQHKNGYSSEGLRKMQRIIGKPVIGFGYLLKIRKLTQHSKQKTFK